MNISSTRLHLTKPHTQHHAKLSPVKDREECRAEIRDMVIQADNKLVGSLFPKIGGALAGFGAAGIAIKTAQGSFDSALGVLGTVVAGAAAFGLYSYGQSQENLAQEMLSTTIDQAEERGCYSRAELLQWYREYSG